MIGYILYAVVALIFGKSAWDTYEWTRPFVLVSAQQLPRGMVEMIVDHGRYTYCVRGRCTVWHYFPSGGRCPTALEVRLSRLKKAWEWAQEKRT